tara:strand:+ start:864 stop:1871 length:1008 start_codon:yes stop_codon:yes gene_type:complete
MKLSNLEKIDTKKMYKTYDLWPKIAKESFESKFERLNLEQINHIVFTGMGGSGTIGDVFKDILSKENIHVTITKGYILPKTIDASTLIVVVSVSGNTDETLTILKQANEIDAKTIVFSSGGKIEKFCYGKEIFYQKIPMEHSPRASLVKYLFSMLNILANLIPLTNDEILDSINLLTKSQSNISSKNLNEENLSLNLAKWIKNTPIIYYPRGLSSVATRFKNSLQENAKIHVISEELFEACHNDIVAWEKNKKFQPILIRGKDDHSKTKERWEIIKEYFKKKDIEFMEIQSEDGNILSKIINLIYVLDYVSIYLAIINDVDPTPVNAIDFVKSKL